MVRWQNPTIMLLNSGVTSRSWQSKICKYIYTFLFLAFYLHFIPFCILLCFSGELEKTWATRLLNWKSSQFVSTWLINIDCIVLYVGVNVCKNAFQSLTLLPFFSGQKEISVWWQVCGDWRVDLHYKAGQRSFIMFYSQFNKYYNNNIETSYFNHITALLTIG